MPPFSFSSTPEMQELLNAIANNSKNKAQVEQAGGTDMVNGAIQQGLAQRDAAFAQQQAAANAQAQQQALAQQQAAQQPRPQQQSPLNPVSLGLVKSIIENKAGYMGADAAARASNPQETNEDTLRGYADIIRAGARKGAQETRELAKALGIDLSDYDENVTLEDAQRNLKTRQSKELKELLDSQSKYGRTSDQYFDDEYRMAIAKGMSAREAKTFAARKTNRYDAERVSYLRNAYNVYGRDGNYTNDIGVEILQNLAQDNPLVAQVYSQAYGMPMKAQERANALDDISLRYQHDFDIANQNFLHNVGLQNNSGQIQQALAMLRGQIEDALNTNQTMRGVQAYGAQKGIDFDFWKGQEDYKSLLEDEKWLKENGRIAQLAVMAGVKPEDVHKYVAAARGIKIGNDGKASKETIDNAKKLHDMTLSSIKDIREQLEATQDENERKELEQKLKVNQDILTRIEDVAGDALGLSGGEEFPDYTGNEQEDLPVVVRLMEFQKTYGGTDEQLFEAVRNWVHKKDPQITDHFIRSLIQKAGKR